MKAFTPQIANGALVCMHLHLTAELTECQSVRDYTHGLGVGVEWIWFIRVCITVHCTHIFLKTQAKQQST